MDQKSRLEELEHNLKTRNLYRVRELLIDNLSNFGSDKEFLLFCYSLVKKDVLIFQRHDHELLDPSLEKWQEEDYQQLVQNLTNNFSQIRYYLAIQLCLYFDQLKQEAAKLLEAEVELEEQKTKKIRIKRPKRKKRQRSEQENQLRAGIHTTSLLLMLMVVQLMVNN